MEREKLKYFKTLLTKKLSDLLEEAGRTVSGMNKTDEDHFPDPTDRASVETDRNLSLRVSDRERKLINKIKDALKKIDEGTYGICEECGDEISEKRLEARPVTMSCVECKKEEEEMEKQRGIV